MIRIGIDANGGDFGCKTTVPAAMEAIKLFNDTYNFNNAFKALF